MKVPLFWLKELVDYQLSSDELAAKISLNSIGVKQQTEDYLELDLTYNRGDLLSLRGVAYEVAAISDSKIKFGENEDYIWLEKNLPEVNIRYIDAPVPVYCMAKIEGLKVDESPKEWVKKLADSGIRSISNVTDVTNLVMIEYGQPTHAFDSSKVGDSIAVDTTLVPGEHFVTIDGKTRILEEDDIVIYSYGLKKTIGIGGVMGGKDSEVSDSTTSILLEAAIFDPVSIRKTSKRLGLYSEASKRFLHGLSPIRLLQALDAAIRLYQSLGGKLTAINLVGDFNQSKKIINLSIQKVNNLLGLKLDEETITACLKKLSFMVNKAGGDALEVTPPYFRLDIQIEEDVIEEVARMYGYDKIEGVRLEEENLPKLDQSLPNFIYDLKLKLKQAGLTEVQTYSFYSTAVLEALGFDAEAKKQLIKVANPISQETEYLKRDLWPNLLEVVGKNIKKGYKDIGIFEVGKVYYKDQGGRVKETDRLSIALMNNTDNPIQELHQMFQSLSVHLRGVKLNSSLFHPNRQIAGAAEVHLRVLNKLGIEKRVAVMEIDLNSFPNGDS